MLKMTNMTSATGSHLRRLSFQKDNLETPTGDLNNRQASRRCSGSMFIGNLNKADDVPAPIRFRRCTRDSLLHVSARADSSTNTDLIIPTATKRTEASREVFG